MSKPESGGHGNKKIIINGVFETRDDVKLVFDLVWEHTEKKYYYS